MRSEIEGLEEEGFKGMDGLVRERGVSLHALVYEKHRRQIEW
jgi:hypothetical protein